MVQFKTHRSAGESAKVPTVAILMDPWHTWHHQMLHGIAGYRDTHARWNIVMPYLRNISADLQVLGKMHLHGLIIADYMDHSVVQWPQLYEVCRRLHLPVVLAATAATCPGFCQVLPDDIAVGKLAAEHLRLQGFRKFGFYGGNMAFARARLEGFRSALAKTGCNCSVLLPDKIEWNQMYPNQQSKALELWLQKLPRPVAIMGCSDLWARQVSDACHRLGLRIPEDIALVGVNNSQAMCELIDPPLTSIPLNLPRIGFVAAELLDAAMHGQPLVPESVPVAPLQLVVRHSSNILAVDDPDIAEAARFIREKAVSSIRVDDVLNVVRISRRKLELGFQRTFGRTPQKEIWRVRVEHAKALLEHTSGKMARIAAQSGFSNAGRLTLIFRKETGMSPHAWRIRHRENNTMP